MHEAVSRKLSGPAVSEGLKLPPRILSFAKDLQVCKLDFQSCEALHGIARCILGLAFSSHRCKGDLPDLFSRPRQTSKQQSGNPIST